MVAPFVFWVYWDRFPFKEQYQFLTFKTKNSMATQYQKAKEDLKSISQWAKIKFPTDKPAIRQIINDNTHALCSDYDLNDKKQSMLHNYACTLHP